MGIRKVGGISEAERDPALETLFAARDEDEVETAVERHPALSSPIIHAFLRQQHLQLRNERHPSVGGFETRYDALFMVLHERLLTRLLREVRDGRPAEEVRPPHAPYGPAYLTAIVAALGDAVPDDAGPILDPRADGAGIAAELQAIVGHPVDLPAYEPPEGTRWLVVKAGCARCDREHVRLRAGWIDLPAAPQLAAAVRERAVNHSGCPACGAELAYPRRIWIADAPPPGDPVEALTSVWRLSSNLIVYQPPSGTWRVAEAERVLEIRMDGLLRRTPFPDPTSPAEGTQVTTMAVAYSADELAQLLEDTQRGERTEGIPLDMSVFADEMARKLREGLLPLYEAERFVRDRVTNTGGEWPLILPGRLQDNPSDPQAHLIWQLIAEAVAGRRALPAEQQALVMANVVDGYVGLGEPGMAEAALGRAEQLLAAAQDPHPNFRLALLDARADILSKQGRDEEAAAIRRELEAAAEGFEGLQVRLARLRLEGDRVLRAYLSGDTGGALGDYPGLIAQWEAILAALGADDEARGSVRYSYSGELANFAAAVTDAGDWARALEISSDEALPPEERADALQSLLPIPVSETEQRLPSILEALAPMGIA